MSFAKFISVWLVATVIFGCYHRSGVVTTNRLRWQCASSDVAGSESLAVAIQQWTQRIVSADGPQADKLRAIYNLPRAAVSDVSIVRDIAICTEVARVYSRKQTLPNATYAVAVARVGDRYVGMNVNAIEKAGEFWAWVITDLGFRELGRIAG